jgi:hypothetical protein
MVSQLWYLLPLVVVISLVYGATRQEEMLPILWQAVRAAGWMLGFMAVVFVVIWVVSWNL